MKKINKKRFDKKKICKPVGTCECRGVGYFLGFIGAAIYFVSTATGFWNMVLGFLKALVWPTFLIYELLKYVSA